MSFRFVPTPLDTPLGLPEPRDGGLDPALRDAFVASPAREAALARLAEPGALAVTSGQQPGLFTGPLYTVHKALSTAALARVLESGDFKGKRDETSLLHPPGSARRILLVGLGKAGDVDPGRLRRAAGIVAKRARTLGVPDAALHVPAELLAPLDDRAAGRALAEGIGYGAWHFAELKEPPREPKPRRSPTRSGLTIRPSAVRHRHRARCLPAYLPSGSPARYQRSSGPTPTTISSRSPEPS